jgi:nucleotide-binding universal stress UspA family protein
MTDHSSAERPILFAYDGSEQARATFEEAARQLGTSRRAIVMTVWNTMAALPFARPEVVPVELEEAIEARARDMAREGARLAESAGFIAIAVTRGGGPTWQAIVEVADEQDVSIVVMGSHGRTGAGLVLMGSVSAAVARHTHRPVLIVHAAADALDERPAA